MIKLLETGTVIETVFFDFDGVIKESLNVKGEAFAELFSSFGSSLQSKIKTHHQQNGGLSRFDKIPLYLSWAGIELTPLVVNKYLREFSHAVRSKVETSEWVEGAEEAISELSKLVPLFLITATPHDEIQQVLKNIGIRQFFKDAIGSPKTKTAAMNCLIQRHKINPSCAVMIGDSYTDYQAAKENNVVFILRKHEHNKKLQSQLDCFMSDNLFCLSKHTQN